MRGDPVNVRLGKYNGWAITLRTIEFGDMYGYAIMATNGCESFHASTGIASRYNVPLPDPNTVESMKGFTDALERIKTHIDTNGKTVITDTTITTLSDKVKAWS